jgi:hypothetical protein
MFAWNRHHLYVQHVAFLLEATTSSLLLLLPLQDVVYCPRCETVCIEDKDHCAQCAKCLYVFCSFCQDSWHPGSECLDPHEVRQWLLVVLQVLLQPC